jgi:hypothetical protein
MTWKKGAYHEVGVGYTVRSRLMGDLTGHVVVQSDSIAITVVDEGILK